jgi:hypothetical protein
MAMIKGGSTKKLKTPLPTLPSVLLERRFVIIAIAFLHWLRPSKGIVNNLAKSSAGGWRPSHGSA